MERRGTEGDYRLVADLCLRASRIADDRKGSNRARNVFEVLVAKIDKFFLESVAYLFIGGA